MKRRYYILPAKYCKSAVAEFERARGVDLEGWDYAIEKALGLHGVANAKALADGRVILDAADISYPLVPDCAIEIQKEEFFIFLDSE